jgi:hypothetical protein
MQKEKAAAAKRKSESNHYQFHAISLTSFSNISSIPISTRMKMEKSFFLYFLQHRELYVCDALYTHVS